MFEVVKRARTSTGWQRQKANIGRNKKQSVFFIRNRWVVFSPPSSIYKWSIKSCFCFIDRCCSCRGSRFRAPLAFSCSRYSAADISKARKGRREVRSNSLPCCSLSSSVAPEPLVGECWDGLIVAALWTTSLTGDWGEALILLLPLLERKCGGLSSSDGVGDRRVYAAWKSPLS